MITREEITLIGKFNKTHGIKGEISATISAPIEMLRQCSCIVCDIDGIFVPFFINELREKSQDTILITIDGINSDNDAQLLANKDIYILQRDYSSIAQDEDELPVDFFVGFTALINEDIKGTITGIDDSTANVLFIINIDDSSTKLIPAVEEFITSIDIDNRLIDFEVPSELLEL